MLAASRGVMKSLNTAEWKKVKAESAAVKILKIRDKLVLFRSIILFKKRMGRTRQQRRSSLSSVPMTSAGIPLSSPTHSLRLPGSDFKIKLLTKNNTSKLRLPVTVFQFWVYSLDHG